MRITSKLSLLLRRVARGGVSAIAIASVSSACQAPVASQGPRLLVSGTAGDRAPALLLPPAEGGAMWRPAETRAGELDELLASFEGSKSLALASEGLEAAAVRQRLGGVDVRVVEVAADGVEAEAWLERVHADHPEAERLLYLRPAPAQVEGRQAYIFGGCESLRARLGQAQERGLTRLESFLDRLDELLAASWSQALSSGRERLAALAEDAEGKQSPCSPAAREHARELLRCASSSGACQWSPRVFLQDHARVGRVAEAPELGLDRGSCVEELRELMTRADSAAIEVLGRAAPPWSELAARVATLGAIDAAVEDSCAPRRRRVSETTLARLRGQMDAIEGLLATGASFPSTGPEWVESVPDAGTWVQAQASFHVPGHGAVRELARFDAGKNAASTQVRARADALGAAILRSGECLGRAGETPLRWSVYELSSSSLVSEGEVFPETLVCGDLELTR